MNNTCFSLLLPRDLLPCGRHVLQVYFCPLPFDDSASQSLLRVRIWFTELHIRFTELHIRFTEPVEVNLSICACQSEPLPRYALCCIMFCKCRFICRFFQPLIPLHIPDENNYRYADQYHLGYKCFNYRIYAQYIQEGCNALRSHGYP